MAACSCLVSLHARSPPDDNACHCNLERLAGLGLCVGIELRVDKSTRKAQGVRPQPRQQVAQRVIRLQQAVLS
jgi:hypothetical protein